MQGICAQLPGSQDLAVGVVICKASMLDCMGDPSAFYIYICIVLDLVVGVVVYRAFVVNYLDVKI